MLRHPAPSLPSAFCKDDTEPVVGLPTSTTPIPQQLDAVNAVCCCHSCSTPDRRTVSQLQCSGIKFRSLQSRDHDWVIGLHLNRQRDAGDYFARDFPPSFPFPFLFSFSVGANSSKGKLVLRHVLDRKHGVILFSSNVEDGVGWSCSLASHISVVLQTKYYGI